MSAARRSARSWFLVAACAPALAHAREPAAAVEVRSTDCADLRTGELQRLLNLELAREPGEPSPDSLVLRVRCIGDEVELRVVDPRNRQELVRTIPAPARGEPGRERILALSVSELFSSAWLDLLVAPQPTRTQPEPPRTVAPPPVARSPPLSRKPPRRDGVLVGAGLRVRHVQEPSPTGSIGLGYGGWLHRNWGLFGLLAAEYGGRSTALGSVHALFVTLGPRASFRTRARKGVRFQASVAATIAYLRLRGHSSRADVHAGSAQAVAADLGGAIGPSFDLRRGWVELALTGGFLVPGPRGLVSGRDPVRADGGWLGVGVTWAIAPR